MKARVEQHVFGEPEGGTSALVMVALSVVFFALYVYYGFGVDSGSISALVLGTAFLLSGVAEYLPTDRRLESGLLRMTAYGLLVGFVATVLVAPDIVIG